MSDLQLSTLSLTDLVAPMRVAGELIYGNSQPSIGVSTRSVTSDRLCVLGLRSKVRSPLANMALMYIFFSQYDSTDASQTSSNIIHFPYSHSLAYFHYSNKHHGSLDPFNSRSPPQRRCRHASANHPQSPLTSFELFMCARRDLRPQHVQSTTPHRQQGQSRPGVRI